MSSTTSSALFETWFAKPNSASSSCGVFGSFGSATGADELTVEEEVASGELLASSSDPVGVAMIR